VPAHDMIIYSRAPNQGPTMINDARLISSVGLWSLDPYPLQTWPPAPDLSSRGGSRQHAAMLAVAVTACELWFPPSDQGHFGKQLPPPGSGRPSHSRMCSCAYAMLLQLAGWLYRAVSAPVHTIFYTEATVLAAHAYY